MKPTVAKRGNEPDDLLFIEEYEESEVRQQEISLDHVL